MSEMRIFVSQWMIGVRYQVNERSKNRVSGGDLSNGETANKKCE
jgi:hypothetical protein